jgi:5,5'-dehydrodivanillate O-demethylase
MAELDALAIESNAGEPYKVTDLDLHATGPGTLAGRYLRMFWQPICLSTEVEKGRARREQIMSEFVTIYRGASGELHAVADRCPHRGVQLSLGWVQGEEIRCFYHGWKFDGAGQCTEQPAESAGYASRIRIRHYPVREYLGFVFIYLGEGEPPELPRYPELEDESTGVLESLARAPLPCNYFQRLENNIDQVHVNFAHGDVFGAQGVGAIPEYIIEQTDFGLRAIGRRPTGDRITYYHMPNIGVIAVPPVGDETGWATLVVWRVPVDDHSNRSFNVRRAKKPPGATPRPPRDRSAEQVAVSLEILAGRKRLEDIAASDRALLVPVQDNLALLGQGAIADRGDAEHLGRSDVGIIALRRLWRAELQALVDGQPTRKWPWPAEGMTVTSGAREPTEA